MHTRCSYSTAPGVNLHHSFPAPFQVPKISRPVRKKEEIKEEKKSREERLTVKQHWSFIQRTSGHAAMNKAARKIKKRKERGNRSNFISAGTWQRNKSNTKVQWALQISFHMQFVTSREVHPLEELLLKLHEGHCVCHNAGLLEVLEPEHSGWVCVLPSYILSTESW